MTQGERVKEIRKFLGLTMEKFGERLGLTKSSISNLENDNRNLTEQTIRAICREFRINEAWLRDGEGDMFAPTVNDAIGALATEYGLSSDESTLVEKYVKMAPRDREVILNYLCECAAAILAGRTVHDVQNVEVKGIDEMTADEKVEAYRKALEEEQKGEEKSGAS